MIWFSFLVQILSLYLGYRWGRSRLVASMEVPSPLAPSSPKRSAGYRDPAEPPDGARPAMYAVLPPDGHRGPVLLKEGPSVWKNTCLYCGSRFAYRLEDVGHHSGVTCPKCGREGRHCA